MTYVETNKPMLSPDDLYHQLVGLGATIEHHESDLYTPVTPEVAELLARYRFVKGVTTFLATKEPGQYVSRLWYSIPFAYLPFWEGRTRG